MANSVKYRKFNYNELSFFDIIKVVIYMKDNIFNKNYKLYRTVYDIIHPSISKKNISNYSIILDEEIAPIRAFYPKKLTEDTKIIIFLPSSKAIMDDDINYAKVCKEISFECNSIVIGIAYKNTIEDKFNIGLEECYKTIKYLYEQLKKIGIKSKDIILMGESIGANIINGIIEKNKDNELNINKVIQVSPIIENPLDIEKTEVNVIQLNKFKEFFDNYIEEKDYTNPLVFPININEYSNYPKTLIFAGAADPIYEKINKFNEKLDKNKVKTELVKITFADHNVLGNNDEDIKDEVFKKINEYLNS